MIKFIICEDNKDQLFKNSNLVNSVMMEYNYDYKIYRFEEYSSELKKVYKMSGLKIYIIDIELKDASGLDIIKEIREKDFESQIIVLTSHYELMGNVYKSRKLVLDFISKFDDYNSKLKDAIKDAICILTKREVIKFKSKTNAFFVEKNDIFYIIKENKDKKVIIKTKDETIESYKSIVELEKETKGFLKKASRSLLVNFNHIKMIDTKENIILFKNNEKIENMISRNYKKEILNDSKYNK